MASPPFLQVGYSIAVFFGRGKPLPYGSMPAGQIMHRQVQIMTPWVKSCRRQIIEHGRFVNRPYGEGRVGCVVRPQGPRLAARFRLLGSLPAEKAAKEKLKEKRFYGILYLRY